MGNTGVTFIVRKDMEADCIRMPPHLNTWLEYMIRYPSPSLAARNSPMMTPTRHSPILTFILLMIAGIELGSTTFDSAWKRFPPSV